MLSIPDTIKAALIDLDGTIFDSMGIWEEVDRKWLIKHNKPACPEYADTIIAKSFQESARFTIDFFKLDMTEDELMDEWTDMAAYEYAHNLQPKPLVKEYLTQLKQSGLKLAVVTSLMPQIYKPLLSNTNLLHLFDEFCTTSEVGIGKESPHIYETAAARLNVKATECIVFEDILKGLESAKSIGMKTVAVYDKSSQQHTDKIKAISDLYIVSFKDAPLPKKKDCNITTLYMDSSKENTF